MLNINRILFVGEPANVKVGPHNSDPTKLVLKSSHPECAAMLCQGLGIDPGKQWRGSTYFITEVSKAAFLAGLAQIADGLKVIEPTPAKALPAMGACVECGSPDGTHWGFCPNHPENKAKGLN